MIKTDPVLEFLRRRRPGFVSGEELSRRLKVSRAAVWKNVEQLRLAGYRVDARPGMGYRLSAVPDKMFADEIARGLTSRVIGSRIFSYDEVDSTNDVVWRLGEQNAAEGACVFAEHQKKGRGRLGRSWSAPKGKSVLFSVLLRPALPPSEVSKITLVAAVSVAKTVARFCGKTPGIKWPNDILFENRKLCGILTEMSAELDRVKFVVLGVGVNANALRRELPVEAVSLKEIAGKAVSRVDFARKLLKQLDEDYAALKAGSFDELARTWEEFSVTSGRRVVATVMGRKIHGQAAGIDSDGALWIRKDNGLQERIVAGDVHHVAQGGR